MRPNSLVTPRGCNGTLAVIAAVVALAICQTAIRAQTASFDQELAYEDPAAPYTVGQIPGNIDGDYLLESADGSSSSEAVYSQDSDGALAGASNSSSFVQLTGDFYGNGAPGSIVVVDRDTTGASQLSNFTATPKGSSFNIAFDQVSIAQQSGARSFGVGGIVWIYSEGGVRPDPDQFAVERTQLAVKNRPLEKPSVNRGTGSKAIAVRAADVYQFRSAHSQFADGHRRAGIGLLYGYQEFDMFDQFGFVADGGILGRTFSDTRTNNWVSGPFSGLVAQRTIGPISFYGHALGVLGFNDGDIQQNNGIGTEYIPGAVNRLLYAQPRWSTHRMSINDFSPMGMLCAEAGLQITERSSLKFAWNVTYVNNILLSQDRVRFYLPDMGFRDPGEQDFLQQFFYCGVEMVR